MLSTASGFWGTGAVQDTHLPAAAVCRHGSDSSQAISLVSPCRALGREPAYPRSLQKHSGYTLEQLQPAAHALSQLHAKVRCPACRHITSPPCTGVSTFLHHSCNSPEKWVLGSFATSIMCSDAAVQQLMHVICDVFHSNKQSKWHRRPTPACRPCSRSTASPSFTRSPKCRGPAQYEQPRSERRASLQAAWHGAAGPPCSASSASTGRTTAQCAAC